MSTNSQIAWTESTLNPVAGSPAAEPRHQDVPQLTPRQALICGAATGGKDIPPGTWQCPFDEDSIIGWGLEYFPDMSSAEAHEAFQRLVKDGLFLRVCHIVFTHDYFSLWPDSAFLRELPDGLTFCGYDEGEIKSIDDVKAMWAEIMAEIISTDGAAYVWWGSCWGQGSLSGNSPAGPCLGHSCCHYSGGSEYCHHGLLFKRMPDVVLPDMRGLLADHAPKTNDGEKQRTADAAIVALKKIDPSLPCRTSAEYAAAWRHVSTR